MPSAISFAYIDGGYVRTLINRWQKEYFRGETMEVDFRELWAGCEKKFWYDCLPPKKDGEQTADYEARIEPDLQNFERISLLPGYHVWHGKTAGFGGKARQKGVDIKLAVDMLSHARTSGIREMTLITGDADFDPLAQALVNQGIHVKLWSDVRAPLSLKQVVDEYIPIHPLHFINASNLAQRARDEHLHVGLQSGKADPPTGKVSASGKLPGGAQVEIYENAGGIFSLTCPLEKDVRWVFRWNSVERVKSLAADHAYKIEWQ